MTDYSYLNNFEWIINLDMLLKPEELDSYIEDTSIKLFNPDKNINVKNINVTRRIIEKEPTLYTEINNQTTDSDRLKIYNLIRKSSSLKNGGYLLINGLNKLQKILMSEEKILVNILNNRISKESILGSIYSNTYNLDVVFKNIPKNLKYIKKYVEDYLETNNSINDVNLLGENNLDINEYNNMIKNSVLSIVSMPFIDLNKGCIGTINEIINIIDEYFRVNIFTKLPEKITEYVQKYISIYIKDKSRRDDFLDQIKKKYFYLNDRNPDNKLNFFIDLQSPYPLPPNDIWEKQNKKISPEDIHRAHNDPSIKNGIKLLAYQYILFIIINVREISKELLNNDVDKVIVKRLCDSYDALYKYFRNVYSNYFGLTGGNSPYQVDDGGLNSSAQYDMNNTVFRKHINESTKIVRYNNINNIFEGIEKDILGKILYSNIEKDAFSKRIYDISIGGIILYNIKNETSVIRNSIEIIVNYYIHLLNNKKINISYINEIQRKMHKGIHRSDVQKIIIEINSIYKMVINGDILIKKTLALAGASMLAAYLNIILKKNYEIIAHLISIESVINNITTSNNLDNIPYNKIYQRTLINKSKLLLDLLYTQYKILFFKRVYQPYYKYLSNKEKSRTNINELPIKYLDIFKKNIEKINTIWNKKLTVLSNQDLVNIYKNYALQRLSNPINTNINKTKITTGKIQQEEVIINDKLRKEIMSDFYWKKDGKMYKALEGRTKILVPYVNGLGGHGLIDIYKLALDNKKTRSWSSDCIISGEKITVSYLNNYLKDKGWLIVANTPEDVDNSKKWRCLILDGSVNKIPTGQIRILVYNMIMNNKYYNSNTNFTWPDTSNTKLKIMHYCKNIVKSNKFSYCYILVSRKALYNLVSVKL